MTHVVTDNCKGCRYTDCVEVCPVDCFHGDKEMLFINPDECIDCGACVPQCPVQAIYREEDLAESQHHWLVVNADRVRHLPVVDQKQEPLPGAEARRRKLGL